MTLGQRPHDAAVRSCSRPRRCRHDRDRADRTTGPDGDPPQSASSRAPMPRPIRSALAVLEAGRRGRGPGRAAGRAAGLPPQGRHGDAVEHRRRHARRDPADLTGSSVNCGMALVALDIDRPVGGAIARLLPARPRALPYPPSYGRDLTADEVVRCAAEGAEFAVDRFGARPGGAGAHRGGRAARRRPVRRRRRVRRELPWLVRQLARIRFGTVGPEQPLRRAAAGRGGPRPRGGRAARRRGAGDDPVPRRRRRADRRAGRAVLPPQGLPAAAARCRWRSRSRCTTSARARSLAELRHGAGLYFTGGVPAGRARQRRGRAADAGQRGGDELRLRVPAVRRTPRSTRSLREVVRRDRRPAGRRLAAQLDLRGAGRRRAGDRAPAQLLPRLPGREHGRTSRSSADRPGGAAARAPPHLVLPVRRRRRAPSAACTRPATAPAPASTQFARAGLSARSTREGAARCASATPTRSRARCRSSTTAASTTRCGILAGRRRASPGRAAAAVGGAQLTGRAMTSNAMAEQLAGGGGTRRGPHRPAPRRCRSPHRRLPRARRPRHRRRRRHRAHRRPAPPPLPALRGRVPGSSSTASYLAFPSAAAPAYLVEDSPAAIAAVLAERAGRAAAGTVRAADRGRAAGRAPSAAVVAGADAGAGPTGRREEAVSALGASAE